MIHDSKIRKAITNDSIVVRVTSPEDVVKIDQFIQEDSLFQSGLMEPSPFAMHHHSFAVTKDGRLSYHSYSTINKEKNKVAKKRLIASLKSFIQKLKLR